MGGGAQRSQGLLRQTAPPRSGDAPIEVFVKQLSGVGGLGEIVCRSFAIPLCVDGKMIQHRTLRTETVEHARLQVARLRGEYDHLARVAEESPDLHIGAVVA